MGTANILKCVWSCVDLNNDMGTDQWFDTRWGFVKFRNLSCYVASDDSGPFIPGV